MNLKKIGKECTSKFVGTGPSSCTKIIYQAAVSQRLRNNDVNKPGVILMTHTTVFVTVFEFHVINYMKF